MPLSSLGWASPRVFYYGSCAIMMACTAVQHGSLGVTSSSQSDYWLRLAAQMLNLGGFILTTLAVVADIAGLRSKLILRVADALWVYVFYVGAYFVNNQLQVHDIDHMASSGVLVVAAVFLGLPLSVTTFGLLIICPATLVLEFQGHMRRHRSMLLAAAQAQRMQHMEQCMPPFIPGTGSCPANSPVALPHPLSMFPSFLPRAIMVLAILCALNLVAQVIIHAHTALEDRQERQRQRKLRQQHQAQLLALQRVMQQQQQQQVLTAERLSDPSTPRMTMPTHQQHLPTTTTAAMPAGGSATAGSERSMNPDLTQSTSANHRVLEPASAPATCLKAPSWPVDPCTPVSLFSSISCAVPEHTLNNRLRAAPADGKQATDLSVISMTNGTVALVGATQFKAFLPASTRQWLADVHEYIQDLECEAYHWILDRRITPYLTRALPIATCLPAVVYTFIWCFLGMLYTREKTPPEFLFSPSWVLFCGMCCVLLARFNSWTVLETLVQELRRSSEAEEKLADLRNSHAALLEERQALQAQLLNNYQPRAAIDAGTPADQLLNLLGGLITGEKPPPVSELAELHSLLLKGSDLYQPVDLAAKLVASGVDEDVGASLAATLGPGGQRSGYLPHSTAPVSRYTSNPGNIPLHSMSPTRQSLSAQLLDAHRGPGAPGPGGSADFLVMGGNGGGSGSQRASSGLMASDSMSRGVPDDFMSGWGVPSRPHSFTCQLQPLAEGTDLTLVDSQGLLVEQPRGGSVSNPGLRNVLEHIVAGTVHGNDPGVSARTSHSLFRAPGSGAQVSEMGSSRGVSRFGSGMGGIEGLQLPHLHQQQHQQQGMHAHRDLYRSVSDINQGTQWTQAALARLVTTPRAHDTLHALAPRGHGTDPVSPATAPTSIDMSASQPGATVPAWPTPVVRDARGLTGVRTETHSTGGVETWVGHAATSTTGAVDTGSPAVGAKPPTGWRDSNAGIFASGAGPFNDVFRVGHAFGSNGSMRRSFEQVDGRGYIDTLCNTPGSHSVVDEHHDARSHRSSVSMDHGPGQYEAQHDNAGTDMPPGNGHVSGNGYAGAGVDGPARPESPLYQLRASGQLSRHAVSSLAGSSGVGSPHASAAGGSPHTTPRQYRSASGQQRTWQPLPLPPAHMAALQHNIMTASSGNSSGGGGAQQTSDWHCSAATASSAAPIDLQDHYIRSSDEGEKDSTQQSPTGAGGRMSSAGKAGLQAFGSGLEESLAQLDGLRVSGDGGRRSSKPGSNSDLPSGACATPVLPSTLQLQLERIRPGSIDALRAAAVTSPPAVACVDHGPHRTGSAPLGWSLLSSASAAPPGSDGVTVTPAGPRSALGEGLKLLAAVQQGHGELGTAPGDGGFCLRASARPDGSQKATNTAALLVSGGPTSSSSCNLLAATAHMMSQVSHSVSQSLVTNSTSTTSTGPSMSNLAGVAMSNSPSSTCHAGPSPVQGGMMLQSQSNIAHPGGSHGSMTFNDVGGSGPSGSITTGSGVPAIVTPAGVDTGAVICNSSSIGSEEHVTADTNVGSRPVPESNKGVVLDHGSTGPRRLNLRTHSADRYSGHVMPFSASQRDLLIPEDGMGSELSMGLRIPPRSAPQHGELVADEEGGGGVLQRRMTGGGEELRRGGTVGPDLALLDQVEQLLACVDDWGFNVFDLAEASQGHPLSTLCFFLMTRAGLVSEFNMDAWCLARFLSHIEAGYLNNPYHNKTHAAHVLHRLHVLLHYGGYTPHYADQLTLLGCYLSATIHDYEHLGITNDFLINTQDPLAILYNDRAPLENHHLAASWALIRQPGYNFLAHLCRPDFDKLRKLVIELVLSTDMKLHFSLLSQFNAVHQSSRRVARATSSLPSRKSGTAPIPIATRRPPSIASSACGNSQSAVLITGNASNGGAAPAGSSVGAGPLVPVRKFQVSDTGLPHSPVDGPSAPHGSSPGGAGGSSTRQMNLGGRLISRMANLSVRTRRKSAEGIVSISNASSAQPTTSSIPGGHGPPLTHSLAVSGPLEGPQRSAFSATVRSMSPLLRPHPGFGSMPASAGMASSVAPSGSHPGHAPSPLLQNLEDASAPDSARSGRIPSGIAISGIGGPFTPTSLLNPANQSQRTSVSGSGAWTPVPSASAHDLQALAQAAVAGVMTPVDENERMLSLQIAIKAADICNLCDPPETHIRWVQMLEEEFFRQGDVERELGMTISPLFDRNKPGVSKSQVVFMDIVAVPIFTALASVFPGSEPLLQGLMANYNHWVAEGKRQEEAKAAEETLASAAQQSSVIQGSPTHSTKE